MYIAYLYIYIYLILFSYIYILYTDSIFFLVISYFNSCLILFFLSGSHSRSMYSFFSLLNARTLENLFAHCSSAYMYPASYRRPHARTNIHHPDVWEEDGSRAMPIIVFHIVAHAAAACLLAELVGEPAFALKLLCM